MYIYSKIIFTIVLVFFYIITYWLSKNNNTKAVQKLLVFTLSILLTFSIIFQETIMTRLAALLGVSRGPDAVLYLFITLSLSINFLLGKKLLEQDNKIRRITQYISFKEYKDNLNRKIKDK